MFQTDILEGDHEQIRMRDIQGDTLMHLCSERGYLACVQYLYHLMPRQCLEENKAKFTPAVLAIKVCMGHYVIVSME